MFKLRGSKMLFPFFTRLEFESEGGLELFQYRELSRFDEKLIKYLLFCDPGSKSCVVSRIGLY